MKKNTYFLAVLFLGLFLVFSNAKAVTVSPAKIVLTADPGKTIETVMRVGHGLNQTATLYPVIEWYTVKDGEEPVYYPENFGLPTWIKTDPAELTLGPGETKTVVVKINVPQDAEPGGHYAVIFWSTASPNIGSGGSGVGVVTRVGSLVFLEVSGDVKESGKIINFKALKKIIRTLPVGFEYSLENAGNVHLKPEGEIVIKNIFGKTVSILDANPGGAFVLPKTTRKIFSTNWEPKKNEQELQGKFEEEKEKGFFSSLKEEISNFHFGYYKANFAVEFGKEKQLAKASFVFWMFPWRSILIIIAGFALLALIFTKGFQFYNKWVIAKAAERLQVAKPSKPKKERAIKNRKIKNLNE